VRRLLVADPDLQSAALGGDAEVAIAESSNEIERFSCRLLVRESHRVGGDVLLHRRAHVWRRAEESIRRNEAVEPLMSALEIVGVHEELDAPVAVSEVREDGAGQKLVPKRLPEALDLAERLRVLGPTLDVADAVRLELTLEVRFATPRRVLPTLVGEDFARLAVSGDAALERLHHELGPLMVSQVVRDDEARMVVHEGGHVEALVAAQQEREDVRLPELIGLRALEPPRRVFARTGWSLRLDETGLVQDPAHGGLGHAECLHACEQVSDAPRTQLRICLPHRDDGLALSLVGRRRPPRPDSRRRPEGIRATIAVGLHPLADGSRGEPEVPSDRRLARAVVDDRLRDSQLERECVRSA